MFSNDYCNKKEWQRKTDYLYNSICFYTTKRSIFKADHKEKASQLLLMLMETLQLNPWTSLWKHTPNVDKSVGFFFLSANRKTSRIYYATPLIPMHCLWWALWRLCWEKYLHVLPRTTIPLVSEIKAAFISFLLFFFFFFYLYASNLSFLLCLKMISTRERWYCDINHCRV